MVHHDELYSDGMLLSQLHMVRFLHSWLTSLIATLP